jgi:hypothetical protein
MGKRGNLLPSIFLSLAPHVIAVSRSPEHSEWGSVAISSPSTCSRRTGLPELAGQVTPADQRERTQVRVRFPATALPLFSAVELFVDLFNKGIRT